MTDSRSTVEPTTDQFPTDPSGLPQAHRPAVVELSEGDELDLRIAPVAKELGDATVRMLAYNGSIPGPILKVPQDSEVVINVENQGDLEATVHWHGLRLRNRYDGTAETQRPLPVGGRFTYRLDFPDPGVYWYHPHIREDYGQEMGLYGNIVVDPADPDYWPPAKPGAHAHARRHPVGGRKGRAVRPRLVHRDLPGRWMSPREARSSTLV
jgi:FtsP/CotA-like multicopper oxidase with cupredoxin domain